jgi:hypothetical protein
MTTRMTYWGRGCIGPLLRPVRTFVVSGHQHALVTGTHCKEGLVYPSAGLKTLVRPLGSRYTDQATAVLWAPRERD